MTDPIKTFFEALQIQDADARYKKISSAVTKNATYEDPRTPSALNGLQAISDYVGMFSANAPGWMAEVKKQDEIGQVTRVTVAFSGPGADGTSQQQLGQYFIERHDGLLSRLVGFVGTGEQE